MLVSEEEKKSVNAAAPAKKSGIYLTVAQVVRVIQIMHLVDP